MKSFFSPSSPGLLPTQKKIIAATPEKTKYVIKLSDREAATMPFGHDELIDNVQWCLSGPGRDRILEARPISFPNFVQLVARAPKDAIDTTGEPGAMRYLVELTADEREAIPVGYAVIGLGSLVEDERGTWVVMEK